MASVTVRAVAPRDEKTFMRLPERLYAGDPHWVPPLWMAEKERLSAKKNPFLARVAHQKMVAWRGNEPVGRIMAIDDPRHNEIHGDNLAFFGFFEALDSEVAAALLHAAEEWARERGRDVLRGPANPSLNDTCGLLVWGFDDDPMMMMPYNPATYPEWVEAAGYTKAKDLYAWTMDLTKGVNPRSQKILERMEKRLDPAPVVRDLRKETFKEDIFTVREIFIACWQDNWGFVPPTKEEFWHAAKDMKLILDWQLAKMMEIDGKPVAFSLSLSDLHQVYKLIGGRLLPFGFMKLLRRHRYMDRGRMLLLGVLPEHRNKGLELRLITESMAATQTVGWKTGESSWTLEDNAGVAKAIQIVGGWHYKTYRLYDKPLD
ncbi:MAG: N-acetyltransferase [Acidobacteria bacterium]|nr:N-acetyltransferase [Acidobacteriota bacterium]